MSDIAYDALLLVSFGGPEGHEDVIPFLENVLRGKPVPRERMLEVAEHYYHFDGVSPINEQNRQLIAAIESELKRRDINLPIYFGNRNWKPFLVEAVTEMRDHGVRKALGFFTSMFSSYSGCRQYRENIIEARNQVGDGAPTIDKIRFGFNHPGFIKAMAARIAEARESLRAEFQATAPVLFTAHSIPIAMSSNCSYERQLHEACQLVADAAGVPRHELVYQSRSGPPQQPWLEPDVLQRINQLHDAEGIPAIIVAPIGFISDHMEVLYDLDCEAEQLCRDRGIQFARAGTVGTHPDFITMIVDLIEERLHGASRAALGTMGPWHDVCPENCCLYQPSGRPPATRGT